MRNNDLSRPADCRTNAVAHRFFGGAGSGPLLPTGALMLGLASGAVLAGMAPALAAGETFTWSGGGNGTGFASESNWTDITVRGLVPVLDDGQEVYVWVPVLEDGNPTYSQVLFVDDEGNEQWVQGEQVFEEVPVLEEGDIVLPGPPDGEQNMLLSSGTPNISSSGRHVHDVDLLGGEFIIRTGSVATFPGDFFVDGTLTIDGTGTLTVRGEDHRGQNVLTAREVVIDGGTARGTGILRVTGESSQTHESETGIGTTQTGGLVTELTVETPFYDMSGGTLSARVDFATLFSLSGTGEVTSAAVLNGASGSTMTQSGGTMNGTVAGIDSYTQTGGSMGGKVATADYLASAGTISGEVVFSNAFLLTGTSALTETARLTQSGGTMSDVLGPFGVYTQSGGLMSGTIMVDDYTLAGASALSTGGTIDASQAFNLGPEGGTATMEAWLRGTGDLVKTGDSRVILTNGDNDFTGNVAINAGILEVIDGALPDTAAVTIEKDAALQLTTNTDTLFTGSMTGKDGDLIKAGNATATLSGSVDLGDLWLNAGRLNIGTGTSTNEAVFDSAVVAADSTLYIAKGATLTIRVPKHLINNGTLINDGTVHDDLENHGSFANNKIYNANVDTNTGTIDNNKPGYWTGNVESNAGRINNAIDATWNGAVEGNTGSISNNGTWLNGTVTNGAVGVDPGLNWGKVIYNSSTANWHGNIAENYSWIVNAGGTWTGDVLSNHRQIWNDNQAGEVGIGYWIGDIVGNDDTIFNGGGGNWTGDVLANARAGYIKNDAPAVWAGSIYGNDGRIENRGIWTGDVAGSSYIIYNSKTWNGAVIAAGTVTSAETGNVPNIGNTGTIYNGSADAVWTGDVNGNSGRIDNRGGLWDGDVLANSGTISNAAATWDHLPSGDSSWVGNVVGNSGTIINAAGSDWTGNALANAGTIATTGLWTGDITSGGRLEGGGSITGAVVNTGTLALVGDLAVGSVSFGGNSYFDVDLDSAGEGELLTANGAATLDGIVRIKAGSAMTSGDYLTPYVILTAASRTGTFDAVTTDLAFLTPTLDYTATTASVTLQRNAQEFEAVGVTGNQQAVAAEVEALGAGNALYDAILWLTPEEAQAAFDQLSGEIYATAEAMAANNAMVIGNIALDRVDKGLGGIDARGSASGYAATSGDTDGSAGAGLWTQFYGAFASIDGTDETSSAEGSIGGVALGLDGFVGDWRVGLMLDAGTGATNVAALNSSIDSTSYGMGLYGGTNWGDTQLALAGLYTRHDNSSTRNVEFPGVAEELSADYRAMTLQAGAKLSHEFDFGAMSFAPYASAAYISHATDGFEETGGDAALSYDASTAATTVATLGATVGYQTLMGDGILVTATASLGWQHSFAGTADASLSLAGGGPFVVSGTAPQTDVAALAAGLNLDLSDQTALDFAYDAQIGAGSQTHALTGTWTTKF